VTSRSDLTRQLLDLGVERGGVLLVHTSFRAIRPVEGGIDGLVGAMRDALGSSGTLVMPSWSGERDEPFEASTSPSDEDLGAVPQRFWRLPGVRRSGHAHAFAAVGARAGFILQDALPLPPHIPESPVGRVHELDGQILLLGVNHDANTTIHLAEVMSDVPYGLPKHVTVWEGGRRIRVDYAENDHCCRRFLLADAWLREDGSQALGAVGSGEARLVRARAVTRVVCAQLGRDPLVFLHAPDESCEECDLARASIRSE
jgi:aminoglycoside 3-N-acetyltransferase-4